MKPENLTMEELQHYGQCGDIEILAELGRRVLEFEFCYGDNRYCTHRIELGELKDELQSEIPPECPHCGKWL